MKLFRNRFHGILKYLYVVDNGFSQDSFAIQDCLKNLAAFILSFVEISDFFQAGKELGLVEIICSFKIIAQLLNEPVNLQRVVGLSTSFSWGFCRVNL